MGQGPMVPDDHVRQVRVDFANLRALCERRAWPGESCFKWNCGHQVHVDRANLRVFENAGPKAWQAWFKVGLGLRTPFAKFA